MADLKQGIRQLNTGVLSIGLNVNKIMHVGITFDGSVIRIADELHN